MAVSDMFLEFFFLN